ncbi:MAG: hypothetical protein ABWY05_02940 [Noviherbaspirillum sp.]
MRAKASSIRDEVLVAILVGTLLSIAWIACTWRYGFDVADEGYYWYGAQRLLRGEIPMRDFMAYDIGRYAWTAAIMGKLGDDGIFGARMGAAIYQLFTIPIGVLIALRAVNGQLGTFEKIIFAAILTALLNLWVYPYYKVFDYGTSILIVAMLTLMMTSQCTQSWFGAGLILGIAAIMGRNHGVYGAFAALLLSGFLLLKQDRSAVLTKPMLAFVAGTIVGFSPTFVMAMLIDGFAGGFIESVRELVRGGATNLSLPVPWPWTFSKSHMGWLYWATDVTKGLAFIAIVLVPIVAILALMRRPLGQFGTVHNIILCSSFAGIAYAHYAYSRADLTHLALSIAPLILALPGIAALVGHPIAMATTLLGVSILALAPGVPYLAQPILKKPLTTISVSGTNLYASPWINARLQNAEHVFEFIPNARDSFLAIPDSPGLYAIYKKKMQIWEIYSLWPRDPLFERSELSRLQVNAPQVIFLSNHALDGRSELRYSSTHPILYRWIVDNYRLEPALQESPHPPWEVYVRKSSDRMLRSERSLQ